MKIEDIPETVLEAARERGFSDAAIAQMPIKRLFNEFCNWHGLINWGYNLFNLVEALQKAENK